MDETYIQGLVRVWIAGCRYFIHPYPSQRRMQMTGSSLNIRVRLRDLAVSLRSKPFCIGDPRQCHREPEIINFTGVSLKAFKGKGLSD